MDKVSAPSGVSDNTKQVILVAAASILAGVGFNMLIKRSQEYEKRKEYENSSPRNKSPTKEDLIVDRNVSLMLQHEAIEYRLKLETTMGQENALLEELRFLDSSTCDIQKVPHLVAVLALKAFPKIVSPLLGDSKYRSVYGGEGFIPEESFVDQNSYCLSTATFGPDHSFAAAKKFLRAGPRKHIFFSPNEVRACIVTCGRVCPGLNVAIREIHNCLYYNYNVQNIFGIKYGFKGFYEYEWKKLNPKKMRNIHHLGGTILGSSKEPLELDKLMSSIIEHRINQIYCIGGDGTLRAIDDLLKQTASKKLKLSVVGIIKTIEHDVPVIDKSFGFETAVEEAARAIQSAVVEATGFENAVGLVKLMGRHSGYIAMYAALANREVNVCLVPEFQFDLEGPQGLLEYVRQKVLQKKSCIVVVAEGAGKGIRDADLSLSEVDKEGNPKLQDVGVYLNKRIVAYCQEKGLKIAMKYIDPTYMIRDVAPIAYDQQMCSQVAQNAVHGAMAGWTGFAVGNLHGRSCYIPISDVISERRKIEATSSDWQKLLTSTGQPSFLNDTE